MRPVAVAGLRPLTAGDVDDLIESRDGPRVVRWLPCAERPRHQLVEAISGLARG